MKLSTSTNIVHMRPDGSMWPLPRTLELAAQAGWSRFDMSFYDWSLPGTPFLTDNWRSWIEEVAETAQRLGVQFGQCHAYTYSFLDSSLSEEDHLHQQMLVERSLQCCALLGSPLCVSHPDTDWTASRPIAVSKASNMEYFKRLLEYAAPLDISIAVENMCDYSIAPARKYGATPEELAELIDSVGAAGLGICWDFEHAQIMRQDQRQSLLYLGRRVTATHVSDTHSDTDTDLMHIMPLFGRMDWKTIVQTLREIGYTGDFSLEAHNYANTLPDKLLPQAVQLSYSIGKYLMEL